MLLFLSRAFFAGAGERRILLPPTSPRSTEDSLRIRPQLRPTFARRRRADYRNRNSGERPVPRRRAPAPLRVVLAGAGERTTLPPPTSPRSPEDSLRIRTQLRPSFARRRRDYYRKLNSGERGVRRRKAPNQKKRNRGSSDHSVLHIYSYYFVILIRQHFQRRLQLAFFCC